MLKPSHYRRLTGELLVSRRAVAVLAGAALVGAAAGVAPLIIDHGSAFAHLLVAEEVRSNAASAVTHYAEQLGTCSVTDGDTIRCGNERIRLLGIDAPELPGHCRPSRNCAPGDPYASTASLEAATIGPLTIERIGEDHYGRTLALVAGSKGDLSCWQLARDQVIYKADWDNELRVARTCTSGIL